MTVQQRVESIIRNDASCTLRRFGGPEADELFVLCRPTGTRDDILHQAESLYRLLEAVLAAHGGGLKDLVQETVFFRDIRADFSPFRDVRADILRDLGCRDRPPASTLIEQPPLNERERLEISAHAVIPCRGQRPLGRTPRSTPPCEGDARAGFATRIVGLGTREHLYAGNIYGAGGGAFEEAGSMFDSAEDLLRREGLTFRDVVRTWIYLRDIDRDYDALNKARRAFFERAGVTVRPASTGIQGAPFLETHNFSMSLFAIRALEAGDVGVMTTRTLNEAWTYGADFSRGLRVREANKIALYVSGTASVDEEGRTVHVGDLEGQVERMLLNISTLLAAQQACLDDAVSATTYLKHPEDGVRLRQILEEQGLGSLPNAIVWAPVCRPELLCEMELLAALPRRGVADGAQRGKRSRDEAPL